MKPLLSFLSFLTLYLSTAQAAPVIIPNVQVSVNDVSAAAAREKAIAQGHRMAFEQALQQLGLAPSQIGGIPSDEQIMSLTRGFSPDTERQTATSYAATFTFTFDGQAIHALGSTDPQTTAAPRGYHASLAPMQRGGHQAYRGALPVPSPERSIQVQIPLQSLRDLHSIEQSLGRLPQVRTHTLTSLTREAAQFTLNISGEPSQLQNTLAERGWRMENHGGIFVMSPQVRPHS